MTRLLFGDPGELTHINLGNTVDNSCRDSLWEFGSTCSGWVWKRKSEGKMSRFLNQFNKRYFTIDFDNKQFFYSSTDTDLKFKKVRSPFSFNDLKSAYALSSP